MRLTPVGVWVTTAGWLSVVLAFILGTLAPVAVAVALLGGVEWSRWSLRDADISAWVGVQRRAPLGTGVPWVASAECPGGVLSIEPILPSGIEMVDAFDAPGRGEARFEARLIASGPGLYRAKSVRVHIGDPWGLWAQSRDVPAPWRLAIGPEEAFAASGRATGRRHTVQTLVKGKDALETIPELASVRPYAPGDRFRDIDWPRSSRLQEMFTKVRQRAAPRPVWVLVEATASMRWQRRHAKITTAARLAYGVVAAAEAAGVAAGVVVYDEEGATPLLSRSAERRRLTEARQRLEALLAPVPVQSLPRVRPSDGPLTWGQKAFLGVMAVVLPRALPAADPVDGAVALMKRGTTAGLVVAIMDGEEDPASAERAIRMLAGQGHDLVLVIPASGPHHFVRHEAAANMAHLREARAARIRLQGRLRSMAHVTVVGPDDVYAALENIAGWAE